MFLIVQRGCDPSENCAKSMFSPVSGHRDESACIDLRWISH